MIDTHTHPYLAEFADGGAKAVERALRAGVRHMVLPNVDAVTVGPMTALHYRYPEQTSIALGLHPTEVDADWEEFVGSMEPLLANGGFVAVGEIGIDLYWDRSKRDFQIEAFKAQLAIADRLGLPVIIHCREALDDVLQCIYEVQPRVNLIFHSFTGSPDDVCRIREVCDPMFGINGVVTYKSAEPLRDALFEIGLDRIVLETDAPYLAPAEERGKRNEPAFITHVCDKVAEVLGVDPAEVEAATDNNAHQAFGI